MQRDIRVGPDNMSNVEEIRKVWKILSLSNGRKSLRDIACEIHTSKTRVSHIIRYLETLGHIKRIPHTSFITINIPFIEVLEPQ